MGKGKDRAMPWPLLVRLSRHICSHPRDENRQYSVAAFSL
jgi:hypothetical protein